MCVIPYGASTACCASAVIRVVMCSAAPLVRVSKKPAFNLRGGPAVNRGQMRRLSREIRPSTTASQNAIDVTSQGRGLCVTRVSLQQGWCEQQHSALSSWRRRLRLSLLRRQLLHSPRGKACWSPMAARYGVVNEATTRGRRPRVPASLATHRFWLAGLFRPISAYPDIGRGLGWQHTQTTHKRSTTQAASTLSRRSARPSRSSRRRSC